MATTVGTVEIELRAKMEALANDFKQAKSVVDRGSREIQSAADSIGKYFKALGVGLSIEGFRRFIQAGIDAADEMSKLSQKTGIAVQDLAGLQLAFRQSGLEAGSLQTSMSKLAQNMAKGSEAFAAMGLATKNADGSLKSTRDMLGEIADKFASYRDGAEKTAMAVKLFGKSGAEMIPLLNGGSEALAEFDAMAKQLGLTMDENTAKNAEKFNDTMDLVGQGVMGVSRQIVAQLLPTLTGLAGQFLTAMTSGDKLKSTAEFLATALKGLYVAGIAIVEVFKTAGNTLGGFAAAMGAAMSGDFAGAKSILSELKTDIGNSWIETLNQAKAAWNTTGDAAVEAMAATSAAAKAAAPNVEDVAAQAKATEKALEAAGKALDKYFEAETKASEARAKTMGDMEHTVSALERQVAAVKQGELATQALNRQLYIENALRSDAAQKLLPHQREEYARLVAQQYDLEAAMKVAEEAQKAQAAEAEKAAEAMQTAYNRAIERVRDGIGDFFISIIRDGKASFDTLLDFFKQMIAEMIATAAANRILIGLGLVSGSAGAAAGGASSLLGGGSILSKIPGIGGAFAPGGLEPLFGQWGVNSGVLKQTFGAGGMGPPQTSFSLTGAAANIGAGIAGSYLASSLYGGRESSGIGATVGGIAGSWFGPVGTFVGAAVGEALDRALSGSDFSGKRVKLGVITGSGAAGNENVRTLASGLQIGNITRRAGDAGLSDEQINTYLSAFDVLDAGLTAIARGAGVNVNLAGTTLAGPRSAYDGGLTPEGFFGSMAKGELRGSLQDAPAQFVRAWLDATADSFDEQIRPFLARIGGTAEEMLTQFGQIAQIQGIYKQSTDTLKALLETDTIGAVRQQIEDANRSLFDLWAQQGDAIVKFSTELADAEDYAQLTAMVQSRYQTELALIAQVMGALQEISGIFDGTIEQIRLDQMSGPAEQYDYYKSQIDTLAGGIGTMTDPAAILDALKQIDQLTGKSYGLLDEQQKKTIGQEIIDYLDGIETAAETRLNDILGMVGADKANEPGTVANAVQTSLDAANSKMLTQLEALFAKTTTDQQAAADTMQGAANTFAWSASNIPTSITVTIANSEVNA